MPRPPLTPEQQEMKALTQLKYVGEERPQGNCPVCDSSSSNHEVRNHSIMFGDGDVYCLRCGAFVRYWDSG
jgi:hypothetical protein